MQIHRLSSLAVAGLALLGGLLTLNVSSANAAGPPTQPNAAQLQVGLQRLGVVGSVLYVAAHPDDENTGLLAYLANGALLRTGYLSITRGDGGQNLIGPEQGPELGLIRTQELLAARRIDGAEQFFTRARDFGFSKSPQETLKIWGKDEILADVVAVIRRFRPDVIITRFSPEPAETHGHHTASAMLAVEAFAAAADPLFHPEQLKGDVKPWQARRILWNRATFFAKPGEDFSRYDKLDIGGYNPLLGASYGEIAAESRSMHKSQGFGVARSRGPTIEYFSTLAAAPGAPAGAVLAGLDFSWARFPGTAALHAAIDRAAHGYDPAHPAASIPALLEVNKAAAAIPDATWRAHKQREVRELTLAAAGLFVDATAADYRVAPGDEVAVTATVINRSTARIVLKQVTFPTANGRVDTKPGDGGVGVPVEVKHAVRVPTDAPPSTPYWLAAAPEPGLYPVADPLDIGKPEQDPRLDVEFSFDVAGQPFTVTRPIAFKWTDPVAGERYRPLEITPVVSIVPDAKVLMFPERQRAPKPLTVRLVAGTAKVNGVLRPEVPAGWAVEPTAAPFKLEAKGDETELAFHVHRAAAPARVAAKPVGKPIEDLSPAALAVSPVPAAPGATAGPGTLRFVAEVGDSRLARGVVHIQHDHIPIQTWLSEATVRLVPLALETAGTNVGYLPGPGDEVAASLRRVGYDVTLISDELLAGGPAALARFDAIVSGVRAFNTNERLRAAHDTLMKYVQAGGTLVIQYNTNSRLGPLSAPLGPHPFEISHDRVTDETAAVTFADLAHPVLTTPNKITGVDFDGWIQERGLYFAGKWDAKYQTVLSMHDAGEKPMTGGLLYARYGRGKFVYTGLAFFRQLPAGVPGAYRLFANLIARDRTGHGK